MSEVKRYDITGEMDGNCNLNEAYMEISDDGVYVRYKDYAEEKHRADQNAAYLETLTARMLAAERERDALQAENAALKVQAEKSKPAIDHWNSWADPEDRIALPVLDQGGWISCSEQMPEIGSTILVHMEDPIHSATPYAVATYDKYGFSRSKVTHWQPLPAPPQPQPSAKPQIDNDGWIEWKGGRCPVSANDNVEIKLRDGGSCEGPGAHILNWANRGFQSDIIAYRVIENDGREG